MDELAGYNTVADNETLADVARHYHVTVPAIEIANHLEAHSTVPVGFMLNVPDRASNRQIWSVIECKRGAIRSMESPTVST